MKTNKRKVLKGAVLAIISIMALATLAVPVAAGTPSAGPGSSQLAVSINPYVPGVTPLPNQRIDVSGTLVGVTSTGTNTPLVGQTIYLSYSTDGGFSWTTPVTTTTRAAGTYAFYNALPNQPDTTYYVQVSFTGNAQYAATTNYADMYLGYQYTAFTNLGVVSKYYGSVGPGGSPSYLNWFSGSLRTDGPGSVLLNGKTVYIDLWRGEGWTRYQVTTVNGYFRLPFWTDSPFDTSNVWFQVSYDGGSGYYDCYATYPIAA